MVKKCFEIVDIESTKSMKTFAYDDIWYYNNYHALGNIFVFPHYMKATFFDSTSDFCTLYSRGVDFDWYKNDDNNKPEEGLQTPMSNNREFAKKFVILKDSNNICYDSGEGRI